MSLFCKVTAFLKRWYVITLSRQRKQIMEPCLKPECSLTKEDGFFSIPGDK